MSKVIVERPRVGHSDSRSRPGRSRPLEDEDGVPLRAREPNGPPRKTKWLNENLAPLKRYLAAQAGRPWNKVYSEISAHLKPSSTVQQHVRDHIEDIVAVRTRMRGGKVVTIGRYGAEAPLESDWRRLFVHPRTGLLRRNPHRPAIGQLARLGREARARALAERMVEVGPDTQLHLFGQDWFEVRLAPIRSRERTRANGLRELVVKPYVDVVKRAGLSDLPLAELYGREGVYAIDKRQISKAEKKRFGIAG
ncbi:MAG: hypothetical protein JNJ73_01245 [Hyphomonadaceae bacterium]|nr:hypothetical protein [Hyphomonadaceae bacterium]